MYADRYYDLKHEAGYAGARNLIQHSEEDGNGNAEGKKKKKSRGRRRGKKIASDRVNK